METTASPGPAGEGTAKVRRRRPTRIDVLGVVETERSGWPLVLARLSDGKGSISLRARTYERVQHLALRADMCIERKGFKHHFKAGECNWALGWLVRDLVRWERDGKGVWRQVQRRTARTEVVK